MLPKIKRRSLVGDFLKKVVLPMILIMSGSLLIVSSVNAYCL